MMSNYNQTCSKIEQLTLALYISEGMYQRHIKKLKNLYAKKAQTFSQIISAELKDHIRIIGEASGIYMLLDISTPSLIKKFNDEYSSQSFKVLPLCNFYMKKQQCQNNIVVFYYAEIPLESINIVVNEIRSLILKK